MEKTDALATRTGNVPDQRAAVRTDLTVSALVVNHTGGEQVRAPGLVGSRVACFAVRPSALFNGYWCLARHLIG